MADKQMSDIIKPMLCWAMSTVGATFNISSREVSGVDSTPIFR